jgi:hypothetical protein
MPSLPLLAVAVVAFERIDQPVACCKALRSFEDDGDWLCIEVQSDKMTE